jgi:hypothetical protein
MRKTRGLRTAQAAQAQVRERSPVDRPPKERCKWTKIPHLLFVAKRAVRMKSSDRLTAGAQTVQTVGAQEFPE